MILFNRKPNRPVPYEDQRRLMVERQLRGKGIGDPRVLEAMGRVPREHFVREADLDDAYADSPLPIDCGQTISQPYMVALMTESLVLRGDEKVLEIGTGSGYQAAVLSVLCREIYSVERLEALAAKARSRLADAGIDNVHIHVGDGTRGLELSAPYDGIIVTAGAPEPPQPLLDQLAVGGRLVIPIGDRHLQTLKVVRRTPEGFEEESRCACKFVPLVGEYGWPE